MRGLLIGYFDNPPTIDIEYSRTLFLRAIEDLRRHYDFQTNENLIIDISSFIRKENGDIVSHIALRTGLEPLPISSKLDLTYALICTICLKEKNIKKLKKGLIY